jgi:periplasmic protein TonB
MNYYILSVLVSQFLHQAAFGNNNPRLYGDAYKSQTDTTKYTVVQVRPEFSGGIVGLKGFIKRNSKIPVVSKLKKRTVTVHLKLLVEKDGRISAAEVVGAGNVKERNQEKYVREARRLALNMPKWRPGSQDGKRLRTYALVTILFKRWI